MTLSKNTKRRIQGFLLSALMLASVGSGLLEAQYFGRNKVQYERFDFKIMKTRHFDIYFYLEDEQTVREAGLMAERWYARLARVFNHDLKGRQPLILYSSGPHFQQTTAIPGNLGEGTGGVTEQFKRRIILPYGASLAETDHVIGHELVHAFQFDITSQGHSDANRQNPGVLRLPLWFIEGLAEYLSIGPVDAQTSMWMRDTTKRKDLPMIKKLDNSYKYFPYRYGHAVWAYISGRWGDESIGRIFKTVGRSGDYEAGLQAILKINIKQLSTDWHKSMQEAYKPLAEATQSADKYGNAILKGTEENVYNVSPALSPDGKEVIFLSTRDLFSIDMFLADAETGKVKRKIISSAIDPHFESLQFIRSAGTWDSTSQRFVFGAISKGKPVLTIFDVKKDKIVREMSFPEMGEILNPAWSPDGRYIAFTALTGGVTDLFIYDLNTDTLKQMTKDSFADLHPAWSPDGKSIAFVTDRFTTNLAAMDIGKYELALIEPESGQVQRVLGFPNGHNINPQWAPDSQSLYFVSDQNGKTDIYRINLQSKKIFQVTNLYTGVSGITELSPAISVAQTSGRLVFSGYDEGHYTVYKVDAPEVLEGQSFLAQFGEVNLALLPPRKQAEGALLGLLKNPFFGLPKDPNFPISGYKPKLSLDYISQPQLAIGVDRYGSYSGGGIAAFWSDMLGYHTVVTMAQVNSRLIDSAVLAAYQNTRHRLNWGGVVQRIPYLYGGYGVSMGEVFGEPAYIEQEEIFRQINYEASGFASYPFNQFRRFELSGGLRLFDFNYTVYTRAYSLIDDYLILNEKQSLPAPKSLYFGFLSGALVYDSSLFGATSPILGQSYILEVAPNVGNLTFATVLADFRKYLMPVRPFTLAFRFMHYGRYGKDAKDDRLWPLYLGYEYLIRGYGSGSFTYTEFEDDFDYSRLYGTKMMIANAELRFPLFNVLGIGKGYYGVWPLEVFGFYDMGVAWNSPYATDTTLKDRPTFFGGDLKPLSSVGFGIRTNVFGYLVLGLNYVYPMQRPSKGWHFQLTITPGF